MLKKIIAEIIGTFFLLLAIGMTTIGVDIHSAGAALAPIAIGLTLAVVVYAGGHISGAHYNPAVTLAVTLRGKCKWIEVPAYIGSQLFAAGLAVSLVAFLKGPQVMSDLAAATATKSLDQVDTVKFLLAEAIGTFVLAFVILNVATAKKTEGNSFYGIAIGMTVTAMAFTLGPISGGAFNPAVALGLAVAGGIAWKSIWIFLVAQIIGAVLAALLFNMTHDEKAA